MLVADRGRGRSLLRVRCLEQPGGGDGARHLEFHDVPPRRHFHLHLHSSGCILAVLRYGIYFRFCGYRHFFRMVCPIARHVCCYLGIAQQPKLLHHLELHDVPGCRRFHLHLLLRPHPVRHSSPGKHHGCSRLGCCCCCWYPGVDWHRHTEPAVESGERRRGAVRLELHRFDLR